MTASTFSRATTSARAGPAKDVFNNSTSAPIRLAAINGSTKPRWLRAIMPTTFGGAPGNVCSAAAKASPSSSSPRHVRVPNSPISPGRSGHRWAAIANPEVPFIPARRTAAAMRAYRSGRSGAISLARDIVPMRPAICFSRSSMSAPPVGKFSSPSNSARCKPLITGPDQTHQPFGHVWVPLRDGRWLQLRRVHVVPSAEIVKQFDVIAPGDGVPEYLETDAGCGGAVKRLGGWDTVLLYNETPNLPQHTLKIGIVDASDSEGFGYDHYRQALARKLHLLEPLRYQLVDIPRRLHRAMWLENTDVDLDYHVRRVQIRAPGGHRELDAAIGEIAGTALDRGKPLWEFHFVEGMADNRFAIIGKIHHALADGVASANLMARALDFPDASWPDRDTYRRDPRPTGGQMIRAAMRDHAVQVRELPRLLKDTVNGIRRVRRNSRSAPGLARNFRPPATFLNHVVSPGRTFASTTLPLSDVQDTGTQLGATINDIELAISTGALRALLLKYDGHADEPLLCGVPMSIDTSAERISGNALGTVVVSLPVQVADPLEWVRLAHTGATIGKENAQLLGSELVSRA